MDGTKCRDALQCVPTFRPIHVNLSFSVSLHFQPDEIQGILPLQRYHVLTEPDHLQVKKHLPPS